MLLVFPTSAIITSKGGLSQLSINLPRTGEVLKCISVRKRSTGQMLEVKLQTFNIRASGIFSFVKGFNYKGSYLSTKKIQCEPTATSSLAPLQSLSSIRLGHIYLCSPWDHPNGGEKYVIPPRSGDVCDTRVKQVWHLPGTAPVLLCTGLILCNGVFFHTVTCTHACTDLRKRF